NTTVRQVGAALGIAVIGSLLNAQTIKEAVRAVRTIGLPSRVQSATIDRIRAKGVNFSPPAGTPKSQAGALVHALEQSVVAGARPALLFAAGVVALGGVLPCLIPHSCPMSALAERAARPAMREYESRVD